jgi:hypothetical protein
MVSNIKDIEYLRWLFTGLLPSGKFGVFNITGQAIISNELTMLRRLKRSGPRGSAVENALDTTTSDTSASDHSARYGTAVLLADGQAIRWLSSRYRSVA